LRYLSDPADQVAHVRWAPAPVILVETERVFHLRLLGRGRLARAIGGSKRRRSILYFFFFL